MFGSAFALTVLVILLDIDDVISFKLKDKDIKSILDNMQRELLSQRIMKDDINWKNIGDLKSFKEDDKNQASMPILSNIMGTEKSLNKLDEKTVLQNILKEVIAHNMRINKKYGTNSNKIRNRRPNYPKELAELGNYSKFYIILNTFPGIDTINKEDLNNLNRLLLELLRSTKKKTQNGLTKYVRKGFAKKDYLISDPRRRDSNEYFLKKFADEYKPSHSKNRHNEYIRGRTGIPFVGTYNVYEEE